jgi:hypothetical protein
MLVIKLIVYSFIIVSTSYQKKMYYCFSIKYKLLKTYTHVKYFFSVKTSITIYKI